MTYITVWERLTEAVARVMDETGRTSEEVKADICMAISDRTIRIRGELKSHAIKGFRASNRVLEGDDFQIPARLKPADIDWQASRPTKSWIARTGNSRTSGYWNLEWVEVSRADVQNALCVPLPASQESKEKTGTSKKSQPARKRAEEAIRELYPRGVPDQASEPNSALCDKVGKKLKEKNLPDVSNDTILRAACRRRK